MDPLLSVRRHASGGRDRTGRDTGPARFEPRHRHAKWRAGHVVEPDLVEEPDRIRVTAVFAADPELQAGARRTALLHGDPYERADAAAVDRVERRDSEDALLEIQWEE